MCVIAVVPRISSERQGDWTGDYERCDRHRELLKREPVCSQNFISDSNQWLAIQVCVPFRAAVTTCYKRVIRALFDLGVPLRGPRSLSQSPGYLCRDPRLAPATRRTQTPATTTATDTLGSVLLDDAPAGLAALVRRSGHRKARNGHRMA